MSVLTYIPKDKQQLMPLFGGKFVENKPIPFPERNMSVAYSNLFYWANLNAIETGEFPLHPHEGFEIMTFVFEGSLEHFDTATNIWTPLKAGGVQVIHAGSGVQHAERIVKGSQLFQIWFDPDFSVSLNYPAEYKDYQNDKFISTKKDDIETIRYVGKEAPIQPQTDGISIYKMILKEGEFKLDIDKDFIYSHYLLSGELVMNEKEVQKDGFVIIEQENSLQLSVSSNAELFVIKSPSSVGYRRFVDRYNSL